MERLTLTSFVKNDHIPVLWAYDTKCKNVPDGVKVKDAGEILHPSRVFSYVGNGDCRAGSYGGFSDIFRYYILFNLGEWYCDMDVTCLKNFSEITQEYVLRPHKRTAIVGNIIKTPRNCLFVKKCIEETESKIDKNNDRWVKPLEILSDEVKNFNLQRYICPSKWFGIDDGTELQKYVSLNYFVLNIKLPKYAIHWCNEAVTTGQWNSAIKRDWNTPIPTTLYYNLLEKYKLI